MVLSETWFLEGRIDFEMQKYRLLAYLKEVNKYFDESKLYPQLADVVYHYNNLISFRDSKQLMQNRFPKSLSNMDVQNLKMVYEEMLEDDEVMRELEQITGYAITQMRTTIDSGAEIYDMAESRLKIEPVGILPLYKNEGFMLLNYNGKNDVRAYNYNITIFEHHSDKYKGIRVTYIDTYQKSITNTYEKIKGEVIKAVSMLPNPAVYFIESSLQLPLEETILPIAKRQLIRYISTQAA